MAVFVAVSVAAPPARLGVRGFEWGLTLSRQNVKSGLVIVQLQNGGEDPHDLRIRRLDRRGRVTGRTLRIEETAPGEHRNLKARLRRGRYVMWCSLPGHRKAGMRAELNVR